MAQEEIHDMITVDEYTKGLVGPEVEWAGTVADGGTIRTHTPPACWGPMITPSFKGGHEVTNQWLSTVPPLVTQLHSTSKISR